MIGGFVVIFIKNTTQSRLQLHIWVWVMLPASFRTFFFVLWYWEEDKFKHCRREGEQSWGTRQICG